MAQRQPVELTDFDVNDAARAARQVTSEIANRAVGLAREAAYISVGLGILAIQRAQVQRREFERAMRG